MILLFVQVIIEGSSRFIDHLSTKPSLPLFDYSFLVLLQLSLEGKTQPRRRVVVALEEDVAGAVLDGGSLVRFFVVHHNYILLLLVVFSFTRHFQDIFLHVQHQHSGGRHFDDLGLFLLSLALIKTVFQRCQKATVNILFLAEILRHLEHLRQLLWPQVGRPLQFGPGSKNAIPITC